MAAEYFPCFSTGGKEMLHRLFEIHSNLKKIPTQHVHSVSHPGGPRRADAACINKKQMLPAPPADLFPASIVGRN